jgi:hypothetical protein
MYALLDVAANPVEHNDVLYLQGKLAAEHPLGPE